MIEDYLELTSTLVQGYIESYAPEHLSSKLVESGRVHQYLMSSGEELKVTVNICEVSDAIYLVSFINKGTEKVDSVLIDWKSEALKTHLPIESVSPELQTKFDGKIDMSINHKISKPFSNTGGSRDDKLRETRHPHPVAPGGADVSSSANTRRIPDMPDFEDEYEVLGRNTGGVERPFPSIGDRDLNPPGLPKYPEMKPYIDPMGGTGEGGMHPLMDHPIFGGRRTSGNSSRLGVPPGARYDDPMGDDGSGAFGGIGSSSRLGSGFPGFGGSGPGPFGF